MAGGGPVSVDDWVRLVMMLAAGIIVGVWLWNFSMKAVDGYKQRSDRREAVVQVHQVTSTATKKRLTRRELNMVIGYASGVRDRLGLPADWFVRIELPEWAMGRDTPEDIEYLRSKGVLIK